MRPACWPSPAARCWARSSSRGRRPAAKPRATAEGWSKRESHLERRRARRKQQHRGRRGEPVLPARLDQTRVFQRQRDNQCVSVEGHRIVLHGRRQRPPERRCRLVLSDAQGRSQEHHRIHRVLERRRGHAVDRPDATYLARAVELAARALAETAPNPPVGAVIVRDGRTLGEGWHHRKGEPHAEAEALRAAREAGEDVRGATMYVTLEPHDHESTMPRCSVAVLEAGIARVVVGALDPNVRTHGNGVARMRGAGIAVDVVDDRHSLALIERFAYTIDAALPFVTLKMAMSLDGFVSPRPGSHRVTGEPARERVYDLRAEHDAVMVGAGTVRVDDPLLTIRPHRTRVKPYARVVVCETAPLPLASRVFAEPA